MNIDLKELQRMGASIRLNQLNVERTSILAAFPSLAPGEILKAEDPEPAEPVRHHTQTPEARQRQSARMRAYWRQRKQRERKAR